MSFLPFYAPSQPPPKVIIAGGGYAGMAALISFYRYCPSADVTLIDPRAKPFQNHPPARDFSTLPRKSEGSLRGARRPVRVSARLWRP